MYILFIIHICYIYPILLLIYILYYYIGYDIDIIIYIMYNIYIRGGGGMFIHINNKRWSPPSPLSRSQQLSQQLRVLSMKNNGH